MFFIAGLTTRRTTVDSGRFHCPNEGAVRGYQRLRARRWFTLFFVPLLPLGTRGDWVRCRSCAATYDSDVLHRHPATPTP